MNDFYKTQYDGEAVGEQDGWISPDGKGKSSFNYGQHERLFTDGNWKNNKRSGQCKISCKKNNTEDCIWEMEGDFQNNECISLSKYQFKQNVTLFNDNKILVDRALEDIHITFDTQTPWKINKIYIMKDDMEQNIYPGASNAVFFSYNKNMFQKAENGDLMFNPVALQIFLPISQFGYEVVKMQEIDVSNLNQLILKPFPQNKNYIIQVIETPIKQFSLSFTYQLNGQRKMFVMSPIGTKILGQQRGKMQYVDKTNIVKYLPLGNKALNDVHSETFIYKALQYIQNNKDFLENNVFTLNNDEIKIQQNMIDMFSYPVEVGFEDNLKQCFTNVQRNFANVEEAYELNIDDNAYIQEEGKQNKVQPQSYENVTYVKQYKQDSLIGNKIGTQSQWTKQHSSQQSPKKLEELKFF